MAKIIYTCLLLWRTIVLDMMVLMSGKQPRTLLYADLSRINGLPFKKIGIMKLNYALLTQKSFRAIFLLSL